MNDDRLPANGTRCASYRSGGIIGGESRTGLSGARDPGTGWTKLSKIPE